ncbi:MAG TPA: hypothetical protein VJ874_01955, partial [Candidatus Thermoplasmatota archaeon]|nr:hypothetical protein [Candidatus Thermoplasmatota archaeon]
MARRPNARRIAILAALAAVTLAAPVLLSTVLQGQGSDSPGAPLTSSIASGRSQFRLESDADAIVADALAEMELLAEASGSEMAQAGAAAESEYAAAAAAAAQVVAEASGQAASQVEQAASAGASLQEAPEGYAGGNVTPSPGATEAPDYQVPT